jgi:hypothetical protein
MKLPRGKISENQTHAFVLGMELAFRRSVKIRVIRALRCRAHRAEESHPRKMKVRENSADRISLYDVGGSRLR